jgi:Trk K+ transport system NAD-binding subunit
MVPFALPSSRDDLTRRDRLVVYYLLGLVFLIAAYTLLYNLAMSSLEGAHQSIFASFEFVVQTMTTTGYGQDSGLWSHPLTFLFVAFVQLSGIGIGFFTLRLIIIPLFSAADVDLDDRLTPKHDHVVICGYRRDSAVLLEELEELGIDYVLIDENREEAETLSDEGYAAIHGDPGEASTFERASVGAARAVIVDAGEANVDAILTVRGLRPDVQLLALTDDGDLEDVLTDAGADGVLSPHRVLGDRLAEKAVSSVGRELTDTVDLGADVEVTEISVHNDSPLDGVRIRDSRVRERTGASIVGAWIDGELQLPPDPDAVISPNTVLVVAGDHESLEELGEFTRTARGRTTANGAVLVGYGEVGSAARSVLDREGIETTAIDRTEAPGVDVVGDGGTRETLQRAGVEDVGVVIVGVPHDSASLLSTILSRSLNEDAQIMVRVSDTDSTEKALRAGADYVLSVPRVSARLIARELRGEDVLGPGSQVRLVRVSAAPFAGTTLAESAIADTDCLVVAVENDDGVNASPPPDYTFEADDRIAVAGTDESIGRFRKRFDILEESG